MYVPKHFAVQDAGIFPQFVKRYPFGVLVSNVDGKPFATHAPFIVQERDGELRLSLHIARANPQWRGLEGQDVLAIFQGPHAMVSAGWYAQPAQSVPTWDYSAVHCSGRARLLDGGQTLDVLKAMVAQFESGWTIEGSAPAYIDQMRQGIVGIEIAVTECTGAFKYSQNRSAQDQRAVLERLDDSPDCGDRQAADAMRSALLGRLPK
ncbi:MAG TPA: FMN-binding negative transcriptional regulator [Candidatus Baltobacteraceae bacterium]|jgi:transcriptional regulator|nr:FMN-binding negative transcriptional regulator [Candidatus Baltobacteraceae bacterium]